MIALLVQYVINNTELVSSSNKQFKLHTVKYGWIDN